MFSYFDGHTQVKDIVGLAESNPDSLYIAAEKQLEQATDNLEQAEVYHALG